MVVAFKILCIVFSGWKQKTRKILKASVRYDISKIHPLILEANSIPLSSRLKDYCQRVYDDLSSGGQGVVARMAAVAGGKRVPKLSPAFAESFASISPSLAQASQLTGAVDECNSTDEDEPESKPNAKEALKALLSPPPSGLWPPTLTFPPKELFLAAALPPKRDPVATDASTALSATDVTATDANTTGPPTNDSVDHTPVPLDKAEVTQSV